MKTLQEKFKDKVLFIKDEQMFNEVTELLKSKRKLIASTFFYNKEEKEFNYLYFSVCNWFNITAKSNFDTELTYEQFKELLKD